MIARGDDRYTRSIFVQCDCWAHGIEFSRFRNAYEVDISLWYRGRWPLSLRERLAAAWRVLTGRAIELDTIALDRDEFQEFARAVAEMAAAPVEKGADDDGDD